MKSSVGYNVQEKPETTCSDTKCPHHGVTSVRGKVFEGYIVSDAMNRSVKIEWNVFEKDRKFSRYFKKTTTITAHNPECIGAREGDKVLVGETRPLSKTKHFTVVKVMKDEGTQEE